MHLITLEPKMCDLKKIVIPKIMNEWEDVADALHYDLATIELINKREGGDTIKCQKLFKDWLTSDHGNEVGPKVWSTLLDVLKEVDEISDDVKQDITIEVNQLRCN